MKVQVAGLLLFVGLPSIASAQQHNANPPDKIPSCVITGVENGGPIITGSIKDKLPASQDAPLGSVTIAVDRYLRGGHFPSGTVTLPVDLDLTKGRIHTLIQTKAVWHEETLQRGKRLLLMLFEENNQRIAVCVVDLDSQSEILPTIEQMVLSDSSESSTKIANMENALSDSSPAIRSLAIDYLDSEEVRDPGAKRFVFEHFAPILLDTQGSRRGEALGAVESAYDPSADGSELNYRILSFIADRIGDPDPRIRSSALQFIHSKLSGGTNRPDPAKIRLTHRAEVLEQLRRDASSGPLTQQAATVLQALGAPH